MANNEQNKAYGSITITNLKERYITNTVTYYGVSATKDALPSTWDTIRPPLDANTPFLWSKTKYFYSDGTLEESTPVISDAMVVVQSYEEYCVVTANSISKTPSETATWSTDFPNTWKGQDYIWKRTTTKWSDGTCTYSPVTEVSKQEIIERIVDILNSADPAPNPLWTVGSWCKENEITIIDGATIMTGSVTADQIDVGSLTAHNSFKVSIQDAVVGGGRNVAYNASITHTAECTSTDFASTGSLKWQLKKAAKYTGTKINENVFNTGDTYTLSFSFQKIAGELINIGGHTSSSTISRVTIDGMNISPESVESGVGFLVQQVQDNDLIHHIAITFIATKEADDKNIYIQPNRGMVNEITYDLWDVKVEKGEVATDWTPAPEDMATATELSVLNGKIESKVAQGEYDATITQLSSSIESKVSSKDYDTTISQLETEIQAKVSNNDTGAGCSWSMTSNKFEVKTTAEGKTGGITVDKDGLTVEGTVNATAGEIGGCKIVNGYLTVTELSALSGNMGTLTAGEINGNELYEVINETGFATRFVEAEGNLNNGTFVFNTNQPTSYIYLPKSTNTTEWNSLGEVLDEEVSILLPSEYDLTESDLLSLGNINKQINLSYIDLTKTLDLTYNNFSNIILQSASIGCEFNFRGLYGSGNKSYTQSQTIDFPFSNIDNISINSNNIDFYLSQTQITEQPITLFIKNATRDYDSNSYITKVIKSGYLKKLQDKFQIELTAQVILTSAEGWRYLDNITVDYGSDITITQTGPTNLHHIERKEIIGPISWKISTSGDNFIESNHFTVSHDGIVQAVDGEFTGVITATGGQIGAFRLEGEGLISDYVTINQTAINFPTQSMLDLGTGAVQFKDLEDATYIITTEQKPFILKNNSGAGIKFDVVEGTAAATRTIYLSVEESKYDKYGHYSQNVSWRIAEGTILLPVTITFYYTIDTENGYSKNNIYNFEIPSQQKNGSINFSETLTQKEYDKIFNGQYCHTYISWNQMGNKPGLGYGDGEISKVVAHYNETNNMTYSLGHFYPADESCCLGSNEKGSRWGGIALVNGAASGSDRRLKYDINQLRDDHKYNMFFDTLLAVKYKMLAGTSGRYHVGFIAQDVTASLLEAGLTTQDFGGLINTKPEDLSGEYSLRYEEFIALCVDQIQKLKKRVEALENQLNNISTEE